MERTLSTDIRLVADMLGQVLRAHGGGELFDHVESMRQAAKRARDRDGGEEAERAREVLDRHSRELSAETALEVVRAFTLYFELVNQAEDVHRARELRAREIEHGDPSGVDESLASIVAELAERGAAREQVLQALSEISLSFVFTAHPTEARRRTTERLLARVRRSLERRDRSRLTPTEQEAEDRHLRAAIEALWEHTPQRRTQPGVLDEVKTGLWYFNRVLLDVVPRVQRRLRQAIAQFYGKLDPRELTLPVGFGSWMGSDRDGNPYVDEEVTEQTLALQREIVLRRYLNDLDDLVDPLAAAEPRMPDHPDLDEALARAAAEVRELVPEVESRNAEEPLRRMLSFIRGRIGHSVRFESGGYTDPGELIADLRVIQDVLARANAHALADDRLQDLIERVRCFGFVLAPLDVREESGVHRRVIAELLGDPDYPEKPDAERRDALAGLKLPADRGSVSEEADRLLRLFESIARLHKRFGTQSIPAYVVSMANRPADLLEVFRLAELHGIAGDLNFVPLLETAAALESAGDHVSTLLDDSAYREHVRRRGDLQEVMVGYSDSMKESGILFSRVHIRNAQIALAEACCAHDVVLRVFHGRGGSVSRGGGPSHRAIRALPAESFSGNVKLTEQGETRASHFGKPDVAERYIEECLGAALLRRYEARYIRPASPPIVNEILGEPARRGREAYRALIEDEGLVPFFRQITPFDAISSLHMASRPARRSGSEELRLSDLRAIPWVFAWSQCRLILTGWYGVGSGFAECERRVGTDHPLQRLYSESPFFEDLIDNIEMSVAKADLSIAERYSFLCEDEGLRKRLFGRMREEFESTRRALLEVTGERAILDHDPVLQESIRLRNPYVDPLSYIQVQALRHARDGGSDEERARWQKVARVAVQGIAAGLRNTG